MRIKDGDWWLVEHDAQMGRTIWARSNPDGSTTYRTDYQAQAIVDKNTAQRNLASNNWKGDYHHVASVPLNVYYDQLHEAAKQDDKKFMAKWLNDSDRRAWRTKSGAI